ncbi:uncharacterized protein MELLADRAFT_95285 [Melampsora larici-populina 98AG31]|uniref:Uncharacterized protein n=1 Tax=Melampsora larici-populina (strain 98AG31 / pathotype 3-4-7) TaxID=747676 RepID=F4RCW3_MELLP|nr:uncharacterized protein MELLADRAFT_95285 [Melampsora larici-populina 98AG31]EGG09794.1 hypothetical protein MELLADRAFT_95285 [Melampsora larici-populina 98AG31]
MVRNLVLHQCQMLTMLEYPSYHQENPTDPQIVSQAHGVQGAQGTPNQTDFYHSGFIGHGQQREDHNQLHNQLSAQQHGGQQSPAQNEQNTYIFHPDLARQDHHNTYSSYPNSAQQDHHNIYNSMYPGSNYDSSNLTAHAQQTQSTHYRSNLQQTQDYFHSSGQSQLHDRNFGERSPKNNQHVASVRLLQSRPPVIQEATYPSALDRNRQPPQASTGTHLQSQPPTTTQKRKNARREGPAGVPRIPPTIEPTRSASLTTPTSTRTQGPTTTRAIHAKNKDTVPPALKNYYLALHDEFDKALAINCINNQVSVKAVRKLWGEKTVRRGPNSYQQWYKSEEVSGIFKETSGVANGKGSTLASSIWSEKSQAEKDSYKVQNQPVNSVTTPNPIDSTPHTDSNTPRTELLSNVRAKNMSLASARAAVNNFMLKWQGEANNMAATYEGDFAIIGVSNYLGDDSYQVVRATPRALKWVEHDRICHPKNHIAAQLQAFVTGTQAGLLNLSKTKLDDRGRCREALSKLISIKTKDKIKKWTWKGCKEKLAEDGYYVQFASDSKSCTSYIMQDSNQLTPTQARDVLDDILHNKILILETEAVPTRKAKRRRQCGSDNPPATPLEDPSTPTNNTTPININTPPIATHSASDNTPAEDA